MASNDVVNLEDGTFDNEVLKSEIPVLVDFWAVWCGPCKAIAPVVEQIATDFKGKVKVAKMDIDKHQAVAQRHLQDRSLPIWRSLTADRAELFREVDGLARVSAPWLEERFGRSGPFWSRHYRFFRGGRELTVIREVFSPALERWLGPSSAQAAASS